jgi:hypothetical protein
MPGQKQRGRNENDGWYGIQKTGHTACSFWYCFVLLSWRLTPRDATCTGGTGTGACLQQATCERARRSRTARQETQRSKFSMCGGERKMAHRLKDDATRAGDNFMRPV